MFPVEWGNIPDGSVGHTPLLILPEQTYRGVGIVTMLQQDEHRGGRKRSMNIANRLSLSWLRLVRMIRLSKPSLQGHQH